MIWKIQTLVLVICSSNVLLNYDFWVRYDYDYQLWFWGCSTGISFVFLFFPSFIHGCLQVCWVREEPPAAPRHHDPCRLSRPPGLQSESESESEILSWSPMGNCLCHSCSHSALWCILVGSVLYWTWIQLLTTTSWKGWGPLSKMTCSNPTTSIALWISLFSLLVSATLCCSGTQQHRGQHWPPALSYVLWHVHCHQVRSVKAWDFRAADGHPLWWPLQT